LVDPLPYQDITVKARLTDPQKTEKILQGINATFVGVDFQKDIYFEIV
jgi:adenylate cyclase class IV